MCFYNVLCEYDKFISEEELRKLINNKLYKIITTLEMSLE